MTLWVLLHILMLVIIYSTLLTKLDQKHQLVKKLRSIRLRKKATKFSNWGHFHFGFKIRLRKVERTTGQLSQLFLSDSGALMLAHCLLSYCRLSHSLESSPSKFCSKLSLHRDPRKWSNVLLSLSSLLFSVPSHFPFSIFLTLSPPQHSQQQS